jgi:hypothetical protein
MALTEDWRNDIEWQIGDYIQCDGSPVLVKITDEVKFTHPVGSRLRHLIAGGPHGFQGTQRDFEISSWRRVDPPKTEGEQ